MKGLSAILHQLNKDAKNHHPDFGLLDYIKNKGLKNLLAPFFEEIESEHNRATNEIVLRGENYNRVNALFLEAIEKLNSVVYIEEEWYEDVKEFLEKPEVKDAYEVAQILKKIEDDGKVKC